MNKKRLFSCWLIFSICKRIPVKFAAKRSQDRNIDIEAVAEELYPSLKEYVDNKWKDHHCDKCKSNIVVMDGNAKLYRSVCAARGEKISNVGRLNEFTACTSSPLPKKNFCANHTEDKSGESSQRLDLGRLTRSKFKELGLDLQELTSADACRKREAINVRKVRSKTAGLVYCFRPCGVSLGHLEAIHAETNTDFIVLLIQIFGTHPSRNDLTGVCIDR